MTTAATALIKGNGRFDLFSFEDNGDSFSVFVKQSNGELYTGKVSIYIKANSERAQRIGFHHDTVSLAELESYVREELLDHED
jgi:hypothetical protein